MNKIPNVIQNMIPKKIQLTDKSYVLKYTPTESIVDYIKVTFNEIFNLHPNQKGAGETTLKSKIMLCNKNPNNPEWNEMETNRWFESYLKTPDFTKSIKKSYMFSGSDKLELKQDLPEIVKPIYDYVRQIDPRYNQVVINWYNGDDYIPQHSDWTDGMIDNYNIGILSMYNDNSHRYLDVVNKQTNEKTSIPMENGSLLLMCGQFQNEFRHGIKKTENPNSKRIGISFRQYAE